MQPVAAEGLVCLGYYDGRMYCLDAATGQERWRYQTGGPILHSAAIVDGNVYFASQDGYVYAVNAGTAQLVWRFKTGKGIQNAPCLSDSTLYVGSGDGFFYALQSIDGTLKWRYDTGFPILTTAACGSGRVYFGNEGLYAYGLRDNGSSAGLLWKKRLQGQSMAGYWPVVSANQQIVFFRTQPVARFHEILGAGDTLLNQGPDGASPANIEGEQQRIISYLTGEGAKWKTFWALDINTGAERYTAPILYTSGEGSIPVPPVVDDQNNRAWLVWRTKYIVFFSGGVRCCVDLGKLNLATGRVTHFAGPEIGYVHLIGDETTFLSAQQNDLLTSGRGTLTGVDLTTESSFSIANSLRPEVDDYWNGGSGPFAYDDGWAKGDILGGGGPGGGLASGAAVAGDQMYWIARYGLLLSLEAAP